MNDLTKLPNIGPTLAAKLDSIGIKGLADLASTGSIQTVIRIGHTDKSACYNMLYAIEGAIRGVRWHAIPKEERSDLKVEFDRITSQ